MRERAIDQFKSIFERASIPVLDIRELELRRISVVLKGHALDESAVKTARHLQQRFQAAIHVHYPAGAASAAAELASQTGFVLAAGAFESTAALIGQVALAQSQMVILPEPDDVGARVVQADDLVKGSAPPVLLLRRRVDRPEGVFRRVLHSLSGRFQQTENFSYSFTLVMDDGTLQLLHAIDRDDIAAVREAMRVAPEVSDQDEREILEQMTRHGERYLKAVVAASRAYSYEVTYRLRLGDVVTAVQQELAGGTYGLLVIGHHEQGYSHITAADYQLMHLVRDVPVLAL